MPLIQKLERLFREKENTRKLNYAETLHRTQWHK